MKEEKQLRTLLAAHHHKVTRARLTVFRNLLSSHQPQTISELIQHTANTVDRVSVYRIIDLFEALGVVKRVHIGWKYKLELSDMFLSHHHHITCLRCGTVTSIEESDLTEHHINALGEKAGYSNVSHQLELQGYCDRCSV